MASKSKLITECKGKILKGLPHREGEGGSGKLEKWTKKIEVAGIYSMNFF